MSGYLFARVQGIEVGDAIDAEDHSLAVDHELPIAVLARRLDAPRVAVSSVVAATVLAGQVYDIANVPRLYVPIYILVRTPLPIFGVALAILFVVLPRPVAGARRQHRRYIALIALTLIFPVACQVALHRPAFTGLRHFLFVIPPLAILAGIRTRLGADSVRRVRPPGRRQRACGLDRMSRLERCDIGQAAPYEYLFYNSIVGGLEGASRRYDMDYWFGSMPEALDRLESYLRRIAPEEASRPPRIYSVAVCGERPLIRRKCHASATPLGLHAAVGPIGLLPRADPHELRQRSRWQSNRHCRTTWRCHRLYQGPSGADPSVGNGCPVSTAAHEPAQMTVSKPAVSLTVIGARELRLDLFRGLGALANPHITTLLGLKHGPQLLLPLKQFKQGAERDERRGIKTGYQPKRRHRTPYKTIP